MRELCDLSRRGLQAARNFAKVAVASERSQGDPGHKGPVSAFLGRGGGVCKCFFRC